MNNGQYLIQIGKKVREIRRAKNISMRQLSVLAPIHKSSLSDIENGKMNVHILALKLLADTLGVDVKDFL